MSVTDPPALSGALPPPTSHGECYARVWSEEFHRAEALRQLLIAEATTLAGELAGDTSGIAALAASLPDEATPALLEQLVTRYAAQWEALLTRWAQRQTGLWLTGLRARLDHLTTPPVPASPSSPSSSSSRNSSNPGTSGLRLVPRRTDPPDPPDPPGDK